MTVPANDAIDIYTAVGGEASFAYTFPIAAASAPNTHEITVQTKSGGLITTLVEGVDYTVTGGGAPGGGTIVLDTGVFPAGAIAGVTWTLFRQIIIARAADFQTSGDFFAADVNADMDKIIRIQQDLSRDVGNAISLPTGSGLTGVVFPLPTSGKDYIRWNDAGTQLVTENVVTVGTATGVDETDTDASKDKMTSNLLTKLANDTATSMVGVTVASFANRFQVSQSLTTVNPILQAIGSDTNVGWDMRTKGSGAFVLTGLVEENKSADIATAASMDVSGVTGNFFTATGNTTVNGFTGRRAGTKLTVRFTGTPTLTHNATTFDLEGEANIAVPADSVGVFRSTSLSPAHWKMESWSPSNGLPVTGVNYPPGYIKGFDIDNDAGDTTNDLLIGVGECRDEDDTTNISLTSSIIKQIDAAWAVGTNQGGYDSTSALANDTWYHIFVIKDIGTGTVDVGFDDDINATNLLAGSGYDAYRRIGSVRRDTAANRQYFYRNGVCSWLALTVDSTANPGAKANITVSVPPDVESNYYMSCKYLVNSGVSRVNVMHPSATLTPTSLNFMFEAGTSGNTIGTANIEVLTNTSSQIAMQAFNSAVVSPALVMFGRGFFDFRGRG